MLFLRSTDKDGKSYGGFQWPMEVGAIVEAPDWSPEPECGRGLHGLLNGCEDGSHLSFSDDAVWWIVEADNAVDLGGKHKFRRCTVKAFGPRHDISAQMHDLCGGAVHGLSISAGDGGTATAGDGGTATAGDGGTATAGYGGTATAGDGGTATAGSYGTATAGDGGTATAGYGGTATAGSYGTATAGYGGTATAGDGGTATAGDGGTATAGSYGTATAGSYGTATAGDGGTLIFLRRINGRLRVLTAYVGENDIKPNVAYRANNDHTAVMEA